MKLVIAIIQDSDTSRLTERLTKDKFRATKLASTGGFLKSGNTTLLVGVEAEKVQEVIDIIKEVCKSTKVNKGSKEVSIGGATIFVLDTNQFKKI